MERERAHIELPPPKGGPTHEVLAEAILEHTSVHQRRSPLDWIASFVVHFAILGVFLVLPLYFTSGLDIQRLNLTFLATPMTPAAPPPPPLGSPAMSHPARTAPVHTFVPGKLTAPSFIPRTIAKTTNDGSLDDAGAGVPGGVPGGIPGGVVGGVLGGVLGGTLRGVAAPAAPIAEGPKKPVRVGGEVKQPKLIYGLDPVYPFLAIQSRISGVVVIDAIIDEHGNVTEERALSGQPILIPAALEAVAKRKYEPTVLDGEPTPIDLRVEVSFRVN
ncbi:MAG: energy transducer TonB [Acidobacteriia bacterium]|nr:energy transducer TonB [Terriglobia bacterium]